MSETVSRGRDASRQADPRAAAGAGVTPRCGRDRRVLVAGAAAAGVAAAVTGQIAGWLAAAAAAALGEKAAPARKRFRNRPLRTTGCTGAIGRAGIPE
jgi:hypothetical protein